MGQFCDFKKQFFNLKGIDLNARKKNLNELLRSTSLNIPLEEIEFTPRNYQEKIFYVDVLIYFRMVDKLLGVLQEGDGVFTSKILKQKWIFEEAFKNLTEHEIVNNFLPKLSYRMRMKVLKKISLTFSEEKMDKIFDYVNERYGLSTAQQFLFSCSTDKFFLVIKTNQIKLQSEQLKRILEKDINLIKFYFKEYRKKFNREFDDYDFLKYLAWKHPELYFELKLDKVYGINLGRRGTKSLLKLKEENVLKNIKKLHERLNLRVITREVKDFDQKYLSLFFPADINDMLDYGCSLQMRSIIKFLESYPEKIRWNVLSRAFKQAFNKDINDNVHILDFKFGHYMPQKIKYTWANLKYIELNDLSFIKFCNPNEAIHLLKEKINVTSNIHQRGQFLSELITVCFENKDYASYEEVLKYICVRHRNDNSALRCQLMSQIAAKQNEDLLTEKHWKYINEMIDVQRVKGEPLSIKNLEQYLVFLYKNGIPLRDAVKQYLTDLFEDKISNSRFLLAYVRCPKAKSEIFKLSVNILKDLPNTKEELIEQLFTSLYNFNNEMFKLGKKELALNPAECPPIMDHIKDICLKKEFYRPQDFVVLNIILAYYRFYFQLPTGICDESKLVSLVKEMSKHDNCCREVYYEIEEILKSPKRNSFTNELLDFYFTELFPGQTWDQQRLVQYFLQNDPKVVETYYDIILLANLKCNTLKKNYSVIKRYCHLNLDQKLINCYSSHAFFKGNNCSSKDVAICALSKVMSTSDFLNLIEEYIPTTKKIDLNNDVQKELYHMQCKIVSCCKYVEDPMRMQFVVLAFCQGDYLQCALPTLYKIFHNTSENVTFSCINTLVVRGLSARKHAVSLGFKLLPVKCAIDLFSVISVQESNPSAKKHLFNAILSYFRHNPTKNLADMVLSNLSFVVKSDIELIEKLVNSVSQITPTYKALFIENVWNYLDVLALQSVNVATYRISLLNIIIQQDNRFFVKLKKNFCDSIIRTFFLSHDDSLITSDCIFHFVIKYLQTYLDDQHFKFIFAIIEKYKGHYWEVSATCDFDIINQRRAKLSYIFNFFNLTYKTSFVENRTEFLILFRFYWERLFSREETFKEYVLLKLMVFHKENRTVLDFAKNVDLLLQELHARYGPFITELFLETLKTFFMFDFKNSDDFNLYSMCLSLLSFNKSDLNCYVVFRLSEAYSDKDKFKRIIQILGKIKTLSSQTWYNTLINTCP